MQNEPDIRIQAGKLRHVITITHMVATSPPTINEAGPVLTPATFATTRAQICPERTVDVVANGEIISKTVIPIAIRYLPGVLAGMQVIAPNGNMFIIQGIVNPGERNVSMELECLAIGKNN